MKCPKCGTEIELAVTHDVLDERRNMIDVHRITIRTDTGEIVYENGKMVSDTTHPPPPDTTIHNIPMPYMPGGVGVTLSVPEVGGESQLDHDAKERKEQNAGHKVGE